MLSKDVNKVIREDSKKRYGNFYILKKDFSRQFFNLRKIVDKSR